MIRRTFLKTFLAGAGASMIDSNILRANSVTKMANTADSKPKKVIIGGAGISGLCCGYELMKAGCDVTVLEAAGRYSGHVFTGRDGLSDGLYADFGADHITKPGYERLFEYTEEFNLPVLSYPNAEGSPLPHNNSMLKMIDGKFYSNEMLADPQILTRSWLQSAERSNFYRRTHGMNSRHCISNATWISLKIHISLLA